MPTIREIEDKIFEARKEKAKTAEKWKLHQKIVLLDIRLREREDEIEGIHDELAKLKKATSTTIAVDGTRESEIQKDIIERIEELGQRLQKQDAEIEELKPKIKQLRESYKTIFKQAPIPIKCRIGRHTEDNSGCRCIYCMKRIRHTTPPDSARPSDCFIATAAYGTPLDPRINALRTYRDRHLPHSLTKLYYRISPPIAEQVRKRAGLRLIVRTLLYPITELARRLTK